LVVIWFCKMTTPGNGVKLEAERRRQLSITFGMSSTLRLLLLAFSLSVVWLSYTFLLSTSPTRDVLDSVDSSETMASVPLKYLSVAARSKHTATVIFVHVGIALSTSVLDIDLTLAYLTGTRRQRCRLAASCLYVRKCTYSTAHQMGSP
jgi:hypothetical protein